MTGDGPGGGSPPRLGEVGEDKVRQDPSVVILGPTGSGKTGVSIELAKQIGGEIISADSRAIYKGMDIGTAKPTKEEMDGVPHFGLDLVNPDERFTVADWKEYALQKIKEIQSRGHIPIIVGGTGLYIDALVYDYKFTADGKNTASDRKELCTNYLLIGIKWETAELRERLRQRLNKMFVQKLYDEVNKLVQKYDWDTQAMKSDIYRYAWGYMTGQMTLEEAKEQCFYADYHLAKRQMTWFKRTKEINWLRLEKICPFVLKYMQDEQRK